MSCLSFIVLAAVVLDNVEKERLLTALIDGEAFG